MNNSLIKSLLVFCILSYGLSTFALGDSPYQNIKKDSVAKKGEFNLTFIGLISSFGPKTSIVDIMEDNHYGVNVSTGGWVSNSTADYPVSSRSPSFGVSLAYFTKDNKGYMVEFKASKLKVEGNSNTGGKIELNSNIKSLSLLYSFQLDDRRVNLGIGPDFLLQDVIYKNYGNKSLGKQETKFSAGLKMAFRIKIIDDYHFSLNFKTDYTFALPVKGGPYETIDGTIPKNNISLNTLDVGLSLGIRFHQN